jgi:superfamily II DNA or RNA helicase
MPTGSGKTAVLMMAPYVLSKKKVLIVTPSVMVRGQIYEEFKNLKTLKDVGVFSQEIKPPNVYELDSRYDVNLLEKLKMQMWLLERLKFHVHYRKMMLIAFLIM